MVILSDIQRQIVGQILINEPLAKFTSFGVGGAADYCLVPASQEDLVRAIAYVRDGALPFILLGGGSNVLVSDEGYRGAAVLLEPGLAHLQCEPAGGPGGYGHVRAEAGVRLTTFVNYCVESSLQGVEVLAGKRGTVGGWVTRNLGRSEASPSSALVEVDLLREGEVVTLRKGASDFPEGAIDRRRDIVLSATFRLAKGKSGDIMRERRGWLLKHNANEPINLARAGVIFKDPPGQRAAELIANVGLKGRRHGRAWVSTINPNFIQTEFGASALDVLALIDLMRRKVNIELHVPLELRVKLIGFDPQKLQRWTKG